VPTDLLSGQKGKEGPADLLEPVDTYTDGMSAEDTPETTQDLVGNALKDDMPDDMAFLYEQTKNKSDFLGGINVLKRTFQRLPQEQAMAVLKLHAGAEAASVVNNDWMTRTLRKANKEGDQFAQDIYKQYGDTQIAPFVPIKITDIAGLGQNIAFSATSMVTGLGAALPLILVPEPTLTTKVAAWGVGTVASGKAAYEMATYDIMQAYLEAVNEETPLTPETEREHKKYFNAAARRYGLWEAVPEAISNTGFAAILTKPLTKCTSKVMAGKILAKIGGIYGEELITEAITQWGQARIEGEYGMREGSGEISPWQALKEVAPQTFLLTSIMAGAGQSAVTIRNKVRESFAKETQGKEISPEIGEQLESYIGDVIKQQQEFKNKEFEYNEEAMTGQKPESEIPDAYVGKGQTKEEVLADIGKGRLVDPEVMREHGIDPNKYILNDKETLIAAEKNRPAAIEKQKDLDRIVEETVAEVTGAHLLEHHADGTTTAEMRAKSATSLALKVARKKADGKTAYTIDNVSDHARNAIILDNFDMVKDIIPVIAKKGSGWTLESRLVEPHMSGYKGVFIKGNNGQEIQLHTKEGWALNLKTDEMYRKFRVMNIKNMTEAEIKEYQDILKKTRKMYEDFYASTVKGSLSELESAISDLAFSSGMGVESSISATENEGRTNLPAEGEKTAKLSPSTKKPDSVSPNISSPSKKSVPQDTGKVKKKPEVIRTAIGKIQKMQERLKDENIKRRKDVESERAEVEKILNRSRLLPTFYRQRMVRAVNQMKGISTKEGRARFSKLLDNIIEAIETVQKRKDLAEYIKEKKFKRVDNLRKAAKLPPIKKMTGKQLDEFFKMLEPYKEGDVFLTQRQIETVDNTDLEGIRTLREAREKFAKEAGITVEQAMGIKVGLLDTVRSDIRLMKQNPLYKMLVELTHKAFVGSDMAFRNFEKKLEKLTIAARKSKDRTFADRLVPTDDLVFQYLEAEDKAALEEQMTKEELELAAYLQEEYAKALEYLIKKETLKTGIDNYVTNVRRGFFEALKGDGFIAAMKEMFDQYKKDEQIFNILDQATDQILPLEKFFQFAMKRTGNINPTKNVAKASSIYFQTFYKKIALDAIMPKMMIYVQAITPEKTTPSGKLEFDTSIKKFVKQWLNTKKGRKAQSGLMKQGGPIDIAIQGLKALITIWDLGINIPVQIAATVGETAAGYVTLGKRGMAKGIIRMNTKQGKKIADKYEGFTGKTMWRELLEPAKDIGDKTMTAVFGLFSSSATRMNKISLLGLMTEQEYKSGEISEQRLAEIKLEMGKMRIISGAKSIGEATTLGGVITQYKTWAVPIFATMSSDLVNLSKKVKKGEALGSEEFTRLRRAMEVTTAALLFGMALGDNDDDNSFVGQLLKKVRREALTIMGALQPTLWTAAPRMLQWIEQLGTAIEMIIKLEKYKEKPGLKGVATLKRMFTPRMISMWLPSDTGKRRPRGMK